MKRWMAERALGTTMLLALLTSCAEPAGKGAPEMTQAGSPAAAVQSLESLAGPEAKEAVAAARAGLLRFLAAIPEGEAASFGFADRAERDRATLGVPYRVWTSDAQANGIAATDEWRFPVIVDGTHRALLTVAQLQGAHRAVDLGAAVLSRELGALESARGVAAGSRRVLLRLHAVQADLAAFPGAGARVEESPFEPLASARAASGGPRSAVEPMNLMPWVRERQAMPSTR